MDGECEYDHRWPGKCALRETADSPPPTSLQLVEMHYKNADLESEIMRHHADFERIRVTLDLESLALISQEEALRQIRGVVG